MSPEVRFPLDSRKVHKVIGLESMDVFHDEVVFDMMRDVQFRCLSEWFLDDCKEITGVQRPGTEGRDIVAICSQPGVGWLLRREHLICCFRHNNWQFRQKRWSMNSHRWLQLELRLEVQPAWHPRANVADMFPDGRIRRRSTFEMMDQWLGPY